MTDPVMSNGQCVVEKFGYKKYHKNLDGMRGIMVEQENLFKEQVQELHRLYKVQKMEMQELGRKKNHVELETAELTDGFSCVSNLEEISGALVRPVARVYKPESGSLSLHPFCSLKLFEGSGSMSVGGSFQRLEPSQNKRGRDFDLERFPDDWVDESVMESDDAHTRGDYTCQKSNYTSDEGLSTNFSSKLVSGAAANEDLRPADPMDQNAKLSHQDSFASVNGCLNSSGSDGEESNSKIGAF